MQKLDALLVSDAGFKADLWKPGDFLSRHAGLHTDLLSIYGYADRLPSRPLVVAVQHSSWIQHVSCGNRFVQDLAPLRQCGDTKPGWAWRPKFSKVRIRLAESDEKWQQPHGMRYLADAVVFAPTPLGTTGLILSFNEKKEARFRLSLGSFWNRP